MRCRSEYEEPLAVWYDDKRAIISLSVRMAEVYTNQKTASMKGYATVAYSTYIVHINCLRNHLQCLTDCGPIFVNFISVFTAEKVPHCKIDDVVEWGSAYWSQFHYRSPTRFFRLCNRIENILKRLYHTKLCRKRCTS